MKCQVVIEVMKVVFDDFKKDSGVNFTEIDRMKE